MMSLLSASSARKRPGIAGFRRCGLGERYVSLLRVDERPDLVALDFSAALNAGSMLLVPRDGRVRSVGQQLRHGS